MAALRDQHRVGTLFAAPESPHEAVGHAIYAHRGRMVYRDELSQFTRIDDLLDPDEIGVIAHDVADPDVTPACGPLRQSAGIRRAFGRWASRAVRRSPPRWPACRARSACPRESRSARHRPTGAARRRGGSRRSIATARVRICGDGLPAQRVELHDACKLQPFGVSDGVFEVFVRAVARSDGDDPDGTIAWVGSVHLFSVRFNSRDAGR